MMSNETFDRVAAQIRDWSAALDNEVKRLGALGVENSTMDHRLSVARHNLGEIERLTEDTHRRLAEARAGVEAAEQEAHRLVEQGRRDADAILSAAHAESRKILDDARAKTAAALRSLGA
jgi:hypothetical protein